MPMDEWEIHPDDLSPAQREVADLIGFENYLKLIDVYAAETIYIPKRDSFERIARNQRIVEEYNGDNLCGPSWTKSTGKSGQSLLMGK